MMGNYHVQFLGDYRPERAGGYPTKSLISSVCKKLAEVSKTSTPLIGSEFVKL